VHFMMCKRLVKLTKNKLETILETCIVLVETVETVETTKKDSFELIIFWFLQFLQFLFEAPSFLQMILENVGMFLMRTQVASGALPWKRCCSS